jgi:uncharacterized protein (DUF305 family)
MKQAPIRKSLAVAWGAGLVVSALAACGSARGTAPAGDAPPPADAASVQAARADSVRQSYTDADVAFMTDMIHHHAQALVMARMAPSHGASGPLRTLSERIIVGQNDEIALMQTWLRNRGKPVPDPASDAHAGHSMHMPGMLTPAELAELDAARGADWDRLFLTYMIRHHQGALTMVEQLFGSYGAAQGDDMFRIASGIAADQTAEIDRMQSMLRENVFGSSSSP